MIIEEQVVLEIRDVIARLSEEDQAQVRAIAVTLHNLLKQDPCAPLAFALVGAELAAQP